MNTICLGCGAPTPRNRWSRCPACAAPLIQADDARRLRKREELGYRRPEVRRAMAEAVRRAGRCAVCGTTAHLTAHLPGGGPHSGDWRRYVALCRECHGRVDGGKRPAA